ncbi:4-coumarate--CoA ligase 1-like isoform X1 [Chrysoperla carnea]|uniref:4-coumarate--CoA ligase 1-like isoform X1 n=1 Tax=Chrysoperla carnea TaxID=189513 RepID=UPI001D09033D|nr:4-coumarate--CoA ligase 1-like isoform X1 [Chrysoperla carnea]
MSVDVSKIGGIGAYYYENCKKHGDKVYIINEKTGEKVTYNEYLTYAIRIALRLQEIGVGEGDVVVFCSNNCIDAVTIPLAILLLGAIAAPVGSDYLDKYKEAFLVWTKPKVLFCDQPNERFFRQLIEKNNLETKVFVFESSLYIELKSKHNEEDNFIPFNVEKPYETIAIIICTSGSTDNFKAVNMLHGTSLDYQKQYLESEKFLDVALINFPYVAGSGILIGSLVSCVGGTVVLLANFSIQNCVKTIHNFKVTHLRVIPEMLLSIARSSLLDKYSLASVKYICVYGSPIFRSQIQECQKKFTNAYIMNTYGCLEAPTIFKFDIEDGKDYILSKGDSVGKLWRKDVEVKLIDPETGKEVKKPERGELYVRGKQLFNGYYKNPEATKKFLDEDGWFRTGDLGYFDEDDCLYILGRKEIVLNINGSKKISPTEIERVVVEHPAVSACCVIGIQKNQLDEPMAVIMKKPGVQATEDDIIKFVKERLPEEKQLKYVAFVKDFPRTPVGKIRVAEVRSRFNNKPM